MSNSRRGAALLLSLWATAALAAAGIAQAARLSQELRVSGRLQEREQSWFLCWTGLEAAAQLLANDPQFAWDAPMEPWGQAPQEALSFSGGSFLYTVADEQARIPLNTASEAVLALLPGFTPEAVQAMTGLRAAGRTIAHLGELPALDGFQSDELSGLEPLVTLQATGTVNLNTASQEVLTLLGAPSTLAEKFQTYRVGSDGSSGTADDAVFSDLEQVVPNLEEAFGPMTPEEQVAMGNLISSGLVGVRSSFFRVSLEGLSERHGVRRRAVAVMERGVQGEALKIRGWHESD